MKKLRMGCAFLLMGVAIALSIGTVGAVCAGQTQAAEAKEVHLWKRIAIEAEAGAASVRLFSSEGLPVQTLVPDENGEAVSGLLEPADYYACTDGGCTAFTLDAHGVLQVSGGRGWTDGERLHLSAEEVGTVVLRGTVSKENVADGWLDYVLTNGSYRRREVVRCDTVGQELRLTFSGVPYGTYSLEESGISVCELTISTKNAQAEVALP